MEMRFFVAVAVAFYSVFTERDVQATTCTDTTDFTCPSTSSSTGTCGVDGRCECISGYSPDDSGCRRDLEQPVVSISDSGVLPYGITSTDFSLRCSPDTIGMGNYLWLTQGQFIESAMESSYDVQELFADTSRNYTCIYTEGDRNSTESEPFELHTLHLNSINVNDVNIQPRIEGMPSILINNTQLTLTCSNHMLYNPTYSWTSDAMIMDSGIITITFEVLESMENTNISCLINYAQDATVFDLTATATIPELSDNIPGIHVDGREDRYPGTGSSTGVFTDLTCAFDVEDFVSTGLDIAWAWYINDTLDIATTQTVTIGPLGDTHHGLWRCTAQLGTKTIQESSAVFVHVDFTFSVAVTIFPFVPLNNGYLEVKCEVDLSEDEDFNYVWFQNDVHLEGYTDDTLYMNALEGNALGNFKCVVELDEVMDEAAVQIIPLISMPSFTPPTLSVNNTSDSFDFEEFYQLSCEIIDKNTITPGTDLIIYEDGLPVTDGSDESIVITGNVTNRTYTCEAVFDSEASPPSNAIEVDFSVIGSVIVNDINDVNITALDAVVGTLVTFKCVVKLEPGVTADVNSVTWYEDDIALSGTDLTIVVNVTDDHEYSCEAEIGSHIRRSSPVNLIAHELASPVLSVLDNEINQNLDFQQTHQLHCNASSLAELFDLTYTFLRDGQEVVTSSSSQMYTLTNDLQDREYTCLVLHQTLTSPPSNVISPRFVVFDQKDIHDLNGDVITSMDGIIDASVTLTSAVSLQPGISGQPTITWYDNDLTEVGTGSTLVVPVTDEGDVFYFYNASLESYWMRSSDNVTIVPHELVAPVLSMVDNAITQNLDFQQSYQLHCNASNLAELFDLTYTFLRDGQEVVTSSSSQMYTLTNDLQDREYTCQVLHQTVTSPPSNVISPRFVVFDQKDIHDLNGDVITSIDGIINASITLTSSVSFQPGISGQPTITWYDQELTKVGTGSTLVVPVTDEEDLFYFYNASLESYWMRSSDNVTIVPHELITPVLSLNNNISGDGLNFSETYTLHCDVGSVLSAIGLDYEYSSQDGTVTHTDSNATYTISNDVNNREYTCKAFILNVTSPSSNSVFTSFEVLGGLNITLESVACHVQSAIDPMYRADFTCDVTLMPGVPDDVTYTWYDLSDNTTMTSATFTVFVQGNVSTSFTCQAQIGSHVDNVSLSYEVSASVLMQAIPCCAPSLHLQLSLIFSLLSVLSLANCCWTP